MIPQGIVSDPALQGFSKFSVKVDAGWFISENVINGQKTNKLQFIKQMGWEQFIKNGNLFVWIEEEDVGGGLMSNSYSQTYVNQ